MKSLAIVASMLWLAATASAQTPPRTASWTYDLLPESAVWPHAIGIHNCLSQYPETAKSQRLEGTTSLTYRIAADGTVKAVKIRKSSGSAILDKAAVACIKAWTYKPAQQDGKPIATAWRNDVKWVVLPGSEESRPKSDVPDIVIQTAPPTNAITTQKTPAPPVNAIMAHSTGTPPPISRPASIGAPHSCTEYYPPDAFAEISQGITTIKFKISVDGHTKDIGVIKSSGYATLDDAAILCASRWQYKPALQNGNPVEVPWQAAINFSLN